MGRMNSSSSSCEQDSLLDDSFKNYEWNFPGLRKNVAGSTQHQIEADIKSSDQDGIKELVLLQQRTVLQVLFNIPHSTRVITHPRFVLLQTVDRLKLCAHRSQYTPNQPMTEMAKILAQLRKAFDSMLDKMFIKELRVSCWFIWLEAGSHYAYCIFSPWFEKLIYPRMPLPWDQLCIV